MWLHCHTFCAYYKALLARKLTCPKQMHLVSVFSPLTYLSQSFMFVVGCCERVQGARVAVQVAHELTAARGVDQSGPPRKAQKGGKQQQPQNQRRKPAPPGGVAAGVASGVAAEGGAAAGVGQGAAPLRAAGCLLLSYPLHPPDKTVSQGLRHMCAGKGVGAVLEGTVQGGLWVGGLETCVSAGSLRGQVCARGQHAAQCCSRMHTTAQAHRRVCPPALLQAALHHPAFALDDLTQQALRDIPLVDLQLPMLFIRGTKDPFSSDGPFKALLPRLQSHNVQVGCESVWSV